MQNERGSKLRLLAFTYGSPNPFLYLPHDAIENEARRIGAALGSGSAFGTGAIEFSTSSGADRQRGRLWTEAADKAHYEALCRAVKRDAVHDKESGLWVKRTSLEAFDAYHTAEKKALEELVARNRKYAIEVLGGRIAKDES
jgi:hypothetical protein